MRGGGVDTPIHTMLLRQLLRILQTRVDNVKDLLVASGIKQILFDMIQVKQSVQQPNGNQNGTRVVGKSNVEVNILGVVRFGSDMSALQKDFHVREATGEAGQKDKLSYVSLLKQIEEGKDKGYSDKEIVNAVIKAITS